MKKIVSHTSFIAKVGALFLVLVIGAYVNPSPELSSVSDDSPGEVVEHRTEIDANSLIRTVSYRNSGEPLLQISK